MRVKVIIEEGIARSVLADGDVDVEIVDIDPDYEDYDAFEAYATELRNDNSLKPREFTVARFEDGVPEQGKQYCSS